MRSPSSPPPELLDRPVWDAAGRRLLVGGQVVKEFQRHAENQVLVLTAFEEQGWACRIDDPLPPRGGVDRVERLHNTVRSLNKGQDELNFRCDGTGSAIRWGFR